MYWCCWEGNCDKIILEQIYTGVWLFGFKRAATNESSRLYVATVFLVGQ
jgi:hypothetical protein